MVGLLVGVGLGVAIAVSLTYLFYWLDGITSPTRSSPGSRWRYWLVRTGLMPEKTRTERAYDRGHADGRSYEESFPKPASH